MEKILNFSKKNYKTIAFLLKNTILVFLFLIILHLLNVFDINLILRYRYCILIIFFLAISLLFLFFEKTKKKEIYLPHFRAGFIISLSLLILFSFDFELFKSINFLEKYFLAISIFFYCFLIFLNEKKIKQSIFNQRIIDRKEMKVEQTKRRNFEKRFTKLTKIPILNNIITWIYTEGGLYSLGLFVIVLIAFGLRVYNLTILDPYTDEYAHLVAAKDLINNGDTIYTRAFSVSYFVKMFFHFGNPTSFYEYVFWGRIPGIVFGSLTIIPLYLLARKINKNIAIISAFLFAISPWAIAVARNIREYAFYPFFILIAALLFIKLLEILLNFKKENLVKISAYSSVILLFFYYAYKIDVFSTLKISLLIFPLILVYFFITNFRKIKEKYKGKISILLGVPLSFVVFAIILATNTSHVTFEINMNLNSFRFFFNPMNPPMQWWYQNSFNLLVYLLLGVGTTYALIKGKKAYALPFLIFSGLIFFFIFFFERNIRPRYAFYALPFFTILVATSVYSLFYFIKEWIKNSFLKYLAIFSMLTILVLIFNIRNTIYTITSNQHGHNIVTDEYHSKVDTTIEFFENQDVKDEDVFITTIFSSILQLHFNTPREKTFYYNYRDEERFHYVRDIITNNPQGFMILDSRVNGVFAPGYPKKGSFKIGETTVEVIQNKDEMQIYQWGHLSNIPDNSK